MTINQVHKQIVSVGVASVFYVPDHLIKDIHQAVNVLQRTVLCSSLRWSSFVLSCAFIGCHEYKRSFDVTVFSAWHN